jgi:hypothetical protein
MIEELVLENFRGFRSLDLKDLKPVNLIVGHNNTGKTSLLEGILLSCQPNRGNELPFMFRPVQGSDDLRYFPWLIRDGAQNGIATLKRTDGVDENSLPLTSPNLKSWEQGAREVVGGERSLALTNANSTKSGPPSGFDDPADKLGPLSLWTCHPQRLWICRVVSVQHRDPKSLVLLIGKAYRKRGGEETFQKLLAKIDSRIRKVRIDPGEDGNQVVVDIGLSELLPLAQVGQGVYRLATILADIIGEKTDVLLIDEIENGLHHSVQKQIWTGLAEVAKELNVQIFATTHSGECLHAAHKAFLEHEPYDLGVIQLFRNEDGVQGRLLDKEKIEAAIEADIELR